MENKAVVSRLISRNSEAIQSPLETVRNEPNGRVIALDIDLCSALGNDTNDIMRIVSCMTHNFSVTKYETGLPALLELLVNPQVYTAIDQITRITGVKPFVVFYTHKSGVVDQCCSDDEMRRITAGAGLYRGGANTLAFPAGDLSEGHRYLYNHMKRSRAPSTTTTGLTESSPIYTSLCRVGILTWFISMKLGLDYAAPVYFTRDKKDVGVVAKDLNVEKDKVYLFDDNAVHHARASGLTHARDGNMIAVQAFDFDTMGAEARVKLHSVLSQKFPIDVDFMHINSVLLEDCCTQGGHAICINPCTQNWRDLLEITEKESEPWPVDLVVQGLSSTKRPKTFHHRDSGLY